MSTETHIHIYPTNSCVSTDEMVEWAEAITYLLKGAAIAAHVTVETNTTVESAYDEGLVQGRKAAMIDAAGVLEREAEHWASSMSINVDDYAYAEGFKERAAVRHANLTKMSQRIRSMV